MNRCGERRPPSTPRKQVVTGTGFITLNNTTSCYMLEPEGCLLWLWNHVLGEAVNLLPYRVSSICKYGHEFSRADTDCELLSYDRVPLELKYELLQTSIRPHLPKAFSCLVAGSRAIVDLPKSGNLFFQVLSRYSLY